MITRYVDGGPDTAAILRRRKRNALEDQPASDAPADSAAPPGAPGRLDDTIASLGDAARAVFTDLDLSADDCLTKIAALLKMRSVLLDDGDTNATESHRARRPARGRHNSLEQRRERARPVVALATSSAALDSLTRDLFNGHVSAPGRTTGVAKSRDDLQRLTADLMTA